MRPSPFPALPRSASAPGLGTRNFVYLAVPVFHDSEMMTSMARKLRELEQQLKAQTDEILSKVGPEAGNRQEGLLLRLNGLF